MPSEKVTAPSGVELADPMDFPHGRQQIYDRVQDAFTRSFPKAYGTVKLNLKDVHYADPDNYDDSYDYPALMDDRFLSRRLRGTLELTDRTTNEPLDKQVVTLARVPTLTNRGTFIHGGSDYTTSKQARLLPGIYHRRKENGELEAHFNIKRNTGRNFAIRLEPDTGLYKMDIGTNQLQLYPILKALGVPDDHLKKLWGEDVWKQNAAKPDRGSVAKAYIKLVPKGDPMADQATQIKAIKAALDGMMINPESAALTLPQLIEQRKQAAFNISIPGMKIIHSEGQINGRYEYNVSTPAGDKVAKLVYQQNKTDDLALRIQALYVAPEYRRQKVATWLLNTLDKDHPGARISVYPKAYRDFKGNNKEVVSFYKAAGFILPGGEDSGDDDDTDEMLKEAKGRYGAGCELRTKKGWLVQKNEDGTLRPVGGGYEPEDGYLRRTILRELEEELGIDPKEANTELRFLGRIVGGDYNGCGMFELPAPSWLKPGEYKASNDPDEIVELVEIGTLDDSRYVGRHSSTLCYPGDFTVAEVEGLAKDKSEVALKWLQDYLGGAKIPRVKLREALSRLPQPALQGLAFVLMTTGASKEAHALAALPALAAPAAKAIASPGAASAMPSWGSQYTKYLWDVENAKKQGFDPAKKMWSTFNDVGSPAVGPGIRVPQAGSFSDDQVNRMLQQRVIQHAANARSLYEKAYGAGSFSQLPDGRQMALTDIDYNPGLSKYPKFMAAVHDDDWAAAQREGIRSSQGKPLGRNTPFFNLIQSGFDQPAQPTLHN